MLHVSNYKVYKVKFNYSVVEIYISDKINASKNMVWTSVDGDYIFEIIANLPNSELVKIAESIERR